MERVLSTHRFAFFADGRVNRLKRAQALVRAALGREKRLGSIAMGLEPEIDRAAVVVARGRLDRERVQLGEVVEMRRATRDERGRWVVVARPPSAQDIGANGAMHGETR